MEKSAVTEFFLEYFEKNRMNIDEISEKTGIERQKFSEDYRQALTASEFLELCVFLHIKPETVSLWIKERSFE